MKKTKALQVKQYKGNEIIQRADGYYDATAMCAANAKDLSNYWQSPATTEFLDALSHNTCLPRIKLVQTKKGKGGGTWVHPQIAMHLAQWCSPEFAVLVSQWVIERIQEQADPDLAARRGLQRAEEGYKRDGRSDEWIRRRLDGIIKRKTLASTLKEHGVKKDFQYAVCTDEINKGILGQTAKAYRLVNGIPDNAKLRDCLNEVQIAGLDFAETLATTRMKQMNADGYLSCRTLCTDAANATRNAIDQFMNS